MTGSEYGLGQTTAAKMLAAGLKRASEERRMSLRQIAKIMNYKQAVVLSHMSTGRVPIPIDRAEEIAEVLRLDKATFLRAVLEQRHPDVNWNLLADQSFADGALTDPLAEELQAIIGRSLDEMNLAQRRVLREVAYDREPLRRWLTVQELPTVDAIRRWRPTIAEVGLSRDDQVALKAFLAQQVG